jgi:hypothetical protein
VYTYGLNPKQAVALICSLSVNVNQGISQMEAWEECVLHSIVLKSIIKLKRTRLARHAMLFEKMRNSYRISLEEPGGMRPTARSGRR